MILGHKESEKGLVDEGDSMVNILWMLRGGWINIKKFQQLNPIITKWDNM